MELIIDATVLFCGLIGEGVTKYIIFSSFVKLYAPEYLLDEFSEHKSRIEMVSGLSSNEFDLLFEKLKNRITLVPKFTFDKFLKHANELVPDKDDTEYLALSLALNKIPVWSNDPHFKKQSLVEVFNTKELVDKLKSLGYTF